MSQRDGRVEQRKPTLIDIVNKHGVSMLRIAHVARVRVAIVYAMALHSEPVQPALAMQVLGGVMQLTGERYLLHDVDIAVQPFRNGTKLGGTAYEAI